MMKGASKIPARAPHYLTRRMTSSSLPSSELVAAVKGHTKIPSIKEPSPRNAGSCLSLEGEDKGKKK